VRWIFRSPIFLLILLFQFLFVCFAGSELSACYSLSLRWWVWVLVVVVCFYLLFRANRVHFFEIYQTPFFMKIDVYNRLYNTIVPYVFVILCSLTLSFSILIVLDRVITDFVVFSVAGITLVKHHGVSLEWFIFVTDVYLESQGLTHIFILEGPLEVVVKKLYVESGGDLEVYQDLLRAKIHKTPLWYCGKHLGFWSPFGLGPWSDLRDHLFFI